MMETKDQEYTTKDWLILIGFIILGICLRFFDLDNRPFHHDESLNAIYGRYFYAYPDTQFYRYDPMLHGPFLYNVYPFFYQIFGTTITTARMFMAFMGSALIFLPLLMRRFLTKKLVFILTTFIATAPTLIYWSRYVRHDSPMLIAISFSLLAFLYKDPWKRAFFFIIPLFLQFTMKENAFLHVVILGAYLLYEFVVIKIFKSEFPSYASRTKKFIQENWKPVSIACVIGVFLFILFFTSYFNHWPGVLDGLYRKSLVYWFHQHSVDRISGPFIYQVLFLSWYEQIFLGSIIASVVHFYWKRDRNLQIAMGLLVLISILLHNLVPDTKLVKGFLSEVLKLKISLDFYPFILIAGHAVIASTVFLKEGKQKMAFVSYLFTSLFFTYSLVGEKVPWLSLYPIYFGVLYLALYIKEETFFLEKLEKKKSLQLLLLCCLFFQLRMTIMTNYSRAGDAGEFISQVHTSKPYEKLAYKLQEKLIHPIEAEKFEVLSLKENTWPLTWYLYDLPGYNFYKGKRELSDFQVVLTDQADRETEKALNFTHSLVKIPLRWWWIPPYKKMTLRNWLSYSLSHNPWTPVGQLYIHMFLRNDVDL